MGRPNILYIHSHDTGRYVQPYGHQVPTPNLQRLAEQGVLFRQAFCAAPTCSPSRAGLLTGQCAHSSGMLGLAHRGFSLRDCRQHIVHTLRQVGYQSVLIGVQHVAREAEVIGYDRIIPLQSRDADGVASVATNFLRDMPQEPFFLSVGFVETHREFRAPGPEENARYCLPPRPLPDTPQTRQDMAAFKASARVLDEGIGTVLDALEASGLSDRTLVICTTDHGLAFPGMKCNLADHGIGVMLILRGPFNLAQGGPSSFVGGQVCDALVSHIDLFPTICDLLDVERLAWLQGQSMMPLIQGKAAEINGEIFAEVTYHAAYEPQRAVRTQRWKYIRRFDERRGPVLPNCDDGPSKDVWLQHGWQDRPPASEQLYDLVFDPNETHNLATDPSMAGVLEEMRGRLDRWMRGTDDPLSRGPVPAPAGARVNDPDGLSPREPTIAMNRAESG
ncbi:MAG: sulfatase [Anaerolineae bacterium]|nr:MAG: sulfatase [Anaerolineae bacterium]